jgi:hypothetical protein
MKRVNINVAEEIKNILPETLKKDLMDDERICPTCHGLGVVSVHRIYGIKDDPNLEVKGIHFPYDHQTLTFCPNCFNGVQSLCKYCGKPIKKGYINKCDCTEYEMEQKAIELEKWNKILDKAVKVKEEDVDTMLYCEENSNFYSSVEDFIDDWESEHDEDDELPERLWVTSKREISINAGNVVESACDDLHEDASDNCDYESLQKLLDDWCNSQSGTTTYFPCYEQYVAIDNKYFSDWWFSKQR